MSVLLGNGDGTFQPAVEYATGAGPWALAVGDFNGDGHLDVVTANDGAETVSLLLGKGDGTFKPSLSYKTGGKSVAVAVADVNGDGKLDVIVGRGFSDTNVAVLLGNGDGTFQTYTAYETAQHPYGITAASFRGNGIVDIASGGFDTNHVSVLLGNGDGTFQSYIGYVAGELPDFVRTGDFNQDGKLDIVTANNFGDSVSLLLGNGDGTFQTNVDYPVGAFPTALAVADLNGDGAPDVVAVNDDTNTVSVLINVGNGSGGPVVELTPASLVFATQTLNTSSPYQNINVANTGKAPLSISSLVMVGIDPGDFQMVNGCGATLAAGLSCTVQVSFKPALRGARIATLSVSDNAANSPQTAGLSGTGTVVSRSTNMLAFADQKVGTKSVPLRVMLTNKGATFLSISNILVAGNDPGDFFQTNNCGSGIAANKSCVINVTFGPSATGTRTASISITDNGGGSPQKVALSGRGD
jgi:hypothetical protein